MSMAGSPLRSKTVTRVPSSLNRCTTAAPMPAAPPVTMAVFPLSPRISSLLGNHGGRFDLDLAWRIEQIGHEDHTHRGIVAPHEPLPDAAERAARAKVGRLVAAVRGHAADVFRARARLGEHRDDVLQSLFKLRCQIFGLEHLLRVPPDLACHENEAPAALDAVRVADRRLPARRKKHFHQRTPGGSGSSSQPAWGFGTRVIHALIRRTCSASSAAISRAASRTGFGARLAAMPA